MRVDRFGKKIQKKGRGHQVSFLDQTENSGPLTRVFLIESQKEYNARRITWDAEEQE